MIPIPDHLVLEQIRYYHRVGRISDSVYALCLLSPDEARAIMWHEVQHDREEWMRKSLENQARRRR